MGEQLAYETSPSLASLQSKSEASLSCLSSFTVTSADGRIHFPGPIDLRGFSLKDITIAPDYIQVYGPGHTPNPGTRLNRPAVITLFHSPAVMKLTKEEARLRVQYFGGQLRTVDVSKGRVEFQVQHFTRYGLDDDSEGEEMQQAPMTEELVDENESDRFSFSPQPHQGKRAKEEEPESPFSEDNEPMIEAPAHVPAIPHCFPELKVAFSPSGRMLVAGSFLIQLPQSNQAALQLLDLHLHCTSASLRPGDLPVVQRHTYSQLVKMWTGFVARLFNTSDTVPDYQYLVQLWSLANVLFGDPAVNISDFVNNAGYMQDIIRRHEAEDFAINNNDEVVQLKRRQALYYWLKLFAKATSSPASSNYRKILELMAAASPTEAVALSIETGNYCLASLLSQTSRHCFSKLIESQLRHWAHTKVEQFMHPDLKTIYEVMAASFDSVRGLDWKRLFTLVFIYGSAHNAPITESYKRFFSDSVLKRQTETKSDFRADVKDACYQLLQLLEEPQLFSSQLEGLLNPYSHGRFLEFGHSWLLSQALSDIYALELFPTKPAAHDPIEVPLNADVTGRFLRELLDSGRWEWAAYVMLVAGFSATQFSTILSRYVDLIRCSDKSKVDTLHKLEFCRERLNIPTRLLAECSALNAEYNQAYEEAFRYYLQADDPESAYELLIREVGPACIIRYLEARRLHKELIGAIAELEGLGRVLPTLRLSVQAYRDYCQLLLDAEFLKQSGSDRPQRIQEFLPRIYEVSAAIKKLPTETQLQAAAKSEMAERLGSLYLTCKQQNQAWNFSVGRKLETSLYDGSMHGSAELMQTHMSALLDVRLSTS